MPFLYGKMSAFDIDLFNNRGRIRSTQGRRDQMIPLDDHTWVNKVPKTKHLSAYEPTTKAYIPSPRRMALEAKLNERKSEEDKFKLYFVVERRGTEGELRCYFHQGVYKFVEIDGMKRRESNPYKGKDLAMSKYRRGRIFWAGDFTISKGRSS